MKLFKNKPSPAANKAGDKAANWLASAIIKLQLKWSKNMDRIFNRLHPGRRKAFFVGITIMAVLYSSAVVAFTISHTASILSKPIVTYRQIHASPKTVLPGQVPAYIRRIERFRIYLDSLKGSASGRMRRDSILRKRPGLPDSIRQIETIYGIN